MGRETPAPNISAAHSNLNPSYVPGEKHYSEKSTKHVISLEDLKEKNQRGRNHLHTEQWHPRFTSAVRFTEHTEQLFTWHNQFLYHCEHFIVYTAISTVFLTKQL